MGPTYSVPRAASWASDRKSGRRGGADVPTFLNISPTERERHTSQSPTLSGRPRRPVRLGPRPPPQRDRTPLHQGTHGIATNRQPTTALLPVIPECASPCVPVPRDALVVLGAGFRHRRPDSAQARVLGLCRFCTPAAGLGPRLAPRNYVLSGTPARRRCSRAGNPTTQAEVDEANS